MTSIRVGIMGLGIFNPSAPSSSWAANAHLPSLIALPNYEIVAVANSSVESAQRSILHYKLPASTKAYGSAQEIANDPNVDLVVVAVNVKSHFALAKPAIDSGKNVFVEWPLGATVAEAEELTKLADAKGVKTSVGLQTRFDPAVQKIREIISSGKIGKVVSSSALICSTLTSVDMWPKGIEYFLDIKSGGNEFTIVFGHFLDTFTHVLGDFAQVQGLLKCQYPTISIIDVGTQQIVDPAYPKTAPDHIFVQGVLENEAVASISLRKAKSASDDTNIRWIITGTEGEIEYIIAESGQYQAGAQPKLRVKYGKSAEAEEVMAVIDETPASKVSPPGTNTARLYEGFAKEDGQTVTFASALKTHHLLERIATSSGWTL